MYSHFVQVVCTSYVQVVCTSYVPVVRTSCMYKLIVCSSFLFMWWLHILVVCNRYYLYVPIKCSINIY